MFALIRKIYGGYENWNKNTLKLLNFQQLPEKNEVRLGPDFT